MKLIKINENGTQEEYPGVAASAGSASAGEFPVLDGSGKLPVDMLPSGIGQDAVTATAGETLAAGDLVYFNATGQVFKADASALGKQARGYVNAAVANAALATVFFDDSNTGKTGLTPGATYYLSLVAGGVTKTPPIAAGQIVQEIGFASSADNLRVTIKESVIRA